jgi:hypothetical protein
LKTIRYATYLAIALHFIRLVIRRVFTRINRKPIKDYGVPDKEHCYSAKVVLFYRICFSTKYLFALECYTLCTSDAETLCEYIEYTYPNFKDTICIFDSGADVEYTLKKCLDPKLRNTIFKSSPILGQELTLKTIMDDIIRFEKNSNFPCGLKLNNFQVCKIE